MGIRVWGLGLGFRVWRLGFRVWGLGFRVYGLGFRASFCIAVCDQQKSRTHLAQTFGEMQLVEEVLTITGAAYYTTSTMTTTTSTAHWDEIQDPLITDQKICAGISSGFQFQSP